MFFKQWLSRLKNQLFPTSRRTRRPARAPRQRLGLECLEDRTLLSGSPLSDQITTIQWQGQQVEAVADQWLVRFDGFAGSVADQLAQARNQFASATDLGSSTVAVPQVSRHLGLDGLFSLQTDGGQNYEQVLAQVENLPGFRYLEPNFVRRLQSTFPNDPSFGQLYGLHNIGQGGGTSDADIDAPEAWDLTRGSNSIVVGVIDTGIDYTHPDLVANMWVNPGETPGDGVDNDNNGFIDDVHGYDFVDDDGDPMDGHSHGTHVAGTIGAVGNNNVGITGVAWNVKLMAIQIFDAFGTTTAAAIVGAINYSTLMRQRGVNIRLTNNSWGGGPYAQAEFDAIDLNRTVDILFVAAAGNDGADNDSIAFYPAGYNLPNIISVAATDNRDALANFSNFGATTVDLGAPGVGILSTTPGNTYAVFDGTSMASPHVAGVAALGYSTLPTATFTQMRNAILTGADLVPSLAGVTVTGRRLNAFGTIRQLGLLVLNTSPANNSVVGTPPTSFAIDFSQPYQVSSVQATDLQVNGIAADSFVLTDADTVTFTYVTSPVTVEGLQTLSLAAGAIRRQSDLSNLIAYNGSFRYDALPLQVVATTPVNASIVPLPMTSVILDFNEPVDANSLQISDLIISQGLVTAVNALDADSVEFILSGVVSEDPFTITLPAGAVTDAFGNPGLAYTGNFTLDIDTIAWPALFLDIEPVGSLVSNSSVSASIATAGDVDNFVLDLQAGQTLTVLVDPATTLRPRIQLSGPGVSISASASAAGRDAVLQTVTALTSGAYTIAISGLSSTLGDYTVSAYLNAALEREAHNGLGNDTPAEAQNINAGFVNLGGVVSRAAVVGVADSLGLLPVESEVNNTIAAANDATASFASFAGGLYQLSVNGDIASASDQDWFTLGALQAGDVITITQSGSASNRGTLADPLVDLYRGLDTSPTLVTTSDDDGPGFDALIYRFTVTTPDIYYVRAGSFGGSTGTYQLGVFLDNFGATPSGGVPFSTEQEGNDAAAIANNLTDSWATVGYLSQTSGAVATAADVDLFRYQLSAGDLVTVQIDSISSLDARVSIVDASNNVLAAEDGSSFGPGADSHLYGFRVPINGDYFVRVTRASGTGAYQTRVYLATDTPPPAPVGEDNYSFTATVGTTLTIGITGLTLGNMSVRLLDETETTLVDGNARGTDLDNVISNFIVSETGTYTVRVVGPVGAAYNLVITRNADFDTESNNSEVNAQNFALTEVALGAVQSPPPAISAESESNDDGITGGSLNDLGFANDLTGSFTPAGGNDYVATVTGTITLGNDADFDFFRIVAGPGDTLVVALDGITLSDPYLRLFDNTGTEIAFDDDGGLGLNSLLTYSAFDYTGSYYIVADSYSLNIGTYRLTATITTTDPIGQGNSDWYRTAPVPAGTQLTIRTFTTGDAGFNFNNLVDPEINLYDPNGMLVATDDNSAMDGRNALLVYDVTEPGAYTVQVRAVGGTSGEYLIRIDGLNHAPAVDITGTSALLPVFENPNTNPGTLVSELIASGADGDPIFDSNAGALEGIAIVGVDSTNGSWEYSLDNGGSWIPLGTVSESSALLLASNNATRLRFLPNPGYLGTIAEAVLYRAWDRTSGTPGTVADTTSNGGTTAFSSAIEIALIRVEPLNDAPVLDVSGAMVVTPVSEDVTGGSGTLISALIASAGGDRITDIDVGALEGIAVLGVDNTNGTWQYSINGGTTWLAFGAPSPTSARLLRDSDRVRFLPVANFNGTIDPGLTFRAWDRTTGTQGGTADATLAGGNTAFSSAIETATLVVTSVNDAPVLDNSGVLTFQTLDEDQPVVLGTQVSDLLVSAGGDPISDLDSGAVEGIAVVGVDNSNGVWQYSLNGGTTWQPFGSPTATTARLLRDTDFVRFVPAAHFFGTVSVGLSFRAWDRATGTAGGTGNASINGTPSAFSTALATAAITVNPINDVPSFTRGPDQTLNEDPGAQTVTSWATNISAGAGNESAQTLTFSITSNSNPSLFAVAPLVGSDGTLTFTPASNVSGTATIRLLLQDNGGVDFGGVDTSAEQTFTITVNDSNDAPSFTKGGNQSVLEDAGTQTINGWATGLSVGPPNEAGQTLTFLVTNNSNPSLFASGPAIAPDGTLTYTPAANANGNATITVVVQDSGGTATGGVNTSAAQTFTIGVTPVNDAPTFTRGADQAVSENAGAQTVSGWATNLSAGPADEAGQLLTFQVTNNSNPGLFSVAPTIGSNGTLTYTPASNATGTATITVVIRDNGGTANSGVDTSAAQTFTITVNEVNAAPSFTKGADQTVLEDAGPRSLSGWATNLSAGPADESGQTLTFVVTSNSNPGLFATAPAINSTGTLSFTTASNANGTANITIVLRDSGGTANGGVDTSAAQTFTITVTPVNDAPAFTKGPDQSVNEDASAQSVTGWATGIVGGPTTDELSQTVTFAVTGNSNPSLFAVAPSITSNGTLSYTPAVNASGSATITITLQDSGGTANSGVNTSAAQTFTISVNPINDAPSFTRGADQVVLEDAGSQSVSGWATNLSRGPTDEAGQTLTFLVTNNSNPSLFATAPTIGSTGTLSYTPAANANGSATITVVVQDSGGTAGGGVNTSAAQTFLISVTSVNDVPAFVKGPDLSINEDAGAQSVSNWATGIVAGPADEAGQSLTFAVTDNSNPSLFALAPTVGSNGLLTYTPAPNANGSATITLILQDSGGTANSGVNTTVAQTFTIAVNAVNDVPSFSKGVDQTVNEDAGTQSVSNWATNLSFGPSNEAGQTLTFQVTGNSNPGLFSSAPAVSSSGVLTYTPAANVNGTATITVVVQDSGGTLNGGINTSSSQSFLITVTPVNDAPSFVKGPDQQLNEDLGSRIIDNWATGIVAGPADEVQFVSFVVTDNSNPSLFSVAPVISSSGQLSYAAAANAHGVATITVVLQDSGGTANGGVNTSAAQSFTIAVDGINDAPSFFAPPDLELTPLPRNTLTPNEVTVSSFAFPAINDSDGPGHGIAVVGLGNPVAGTWQYSPDGGTTWLPFGVATTSSARLLLGTDLVRFVPAVNFVGEAQLSFYAWDQTSGVPGQIVNLSLPGALGGTSAFSTTPGTVSQKVAMTLKSVKEDKLSPRGTKVSALRDPQFVLANPATVKGIAVVGLTGAENGTWQFSTNGGLSYQSFNSVSEGSAVLLRAKDLVRFVPGANFNGTATISYRGWDGTGKAGSREDVSLGGTRFSAVEDLSIITVTPINDRPTLGDDVPQLSSVSNTNTNPVGDAVSILAIRFSDLESSTSGIAVVGVTGLTDGRWQFSTNNGATWQDMGAVSATKGRLLGQNDRVRFVPNAGFTGEVRILFKAWDQSRGSAGQLLGVKSTAFSTFTETASLFVVP